MSSNGALPDFSACRARSLAFESLPGNPIGAVPALLEPRRIGRVHDVDALSAEAERRLLEEGVVKKGDVVGIIAGTPLGMKGTTNLLKLHLIGSH